MKNLILFSVLFLTLLFIVDNAVSQTIGKSDSTNMGWDQLADDMEVFMERLEFKDGAFEKWEKIPNIRQLVVLDAWAAFALPYMEGVLPTIDDDQVRQDAAAYIGWLQGDKDLGMKWVTLSNERQQAVYEARNKPDIDAMKILIARLRGN